MAKIAELVARLANNLEIPQSEARQIVARLVPVVEIETITDVDDKMRSEWRAQGTATASAGGAGRYSTCQLNNPAGSGTLIRVERVWIFGQTGMVRAAVGGLGMTTVGESQVLDSRVVSTAAAPVGTVTQGDTATQFPNSFIRIADSFDYPVALGPGGSITVQNENANEVLIMSAIWNERAVGPAMR